MVIRVIKLAVVICAVWSTIGRLRPGGFTVLSKGGLQNRSAKAWWTPATRSRRLSDAPCNHVLCPRWLIRAAASPGARTQLELEARNLAGTSDAVCTGKQRLSYYDRTTVIWSDALEIGAIWPPGLRWS